eukprot:2028468-Amphidinium_carterae.1
MDVRKHEFEGLVQEIMLLREHGIGCERADSSIEPPQLLVAKAIETGHTAFLANEKGQLGTSALSQRQLARNNRLDASLWS